MSSKQSKKNRNATHDVYIGQVASNIKQAALLEVFSKFGEVVDILIRHNPKLSGYAIVKFKHKKDAAKVLREFSKISIDNCEMIVKKGERSNHSVENGNGSVTVAKTVSFAEPFACIQPLGNMNFMDPLCMRDIKYSGFIITEPGWSIPATSIEIMCTNVENAVTFHGCPTSKFDELQNLSNKLNSICPNFKRLFRKPVINKIYGALYDEDQQWYRCSVLPYAASPNSITCFVEYIDYGNRAEVPFTNMVELPEPIKNIHSYAVKCAFADLTASPRFSHTATYLHHLVNNRMSLCGSYCQENNEYQVVKCICNGIDVINELKRNGFALQRFQTPLTSPPPSQLDRAYCSKSQENHKPKKSSGASSNKKTSNVCNGIDRHPKDGKKEGSHDQIKIYRNSSCVESNQIQDFVPKKIIKRGSEACAINSKMAEETETVNHLLKVDSIISSLKVVNDIRGFVPLHTNDDLINSALDFLKSAMDVTTSDESKQLVENVYKEYTEALEAIKRCSTQENLHDLKETRNKLRTDLYNALNNFLENFNLNLLEKQKKIQETITALESNSSTYCDVSLSKVPDTIEDLLAAFNEEKEKRKKSIEAARNNTNKNHEKFMKFYSDLQKEFKLNLADGKTNGCCSASTEGKKGSWALKFDEVLTDLDIALEKERITSTVTEKDPSHVSVIKCISEKLEFPKEKIDSMCEQYKKYKSLFDDLSYTFDLSPVFDELQALSKVIKAFHSGSNNQTSETRSDKLLELHSALLREDELLMDIAKAAAQHFPEFVQEHPELKLEEYQKYSYLLKPSWDMGFFPLFENCNRIEPSYVSKFGGEPVVIKEFGVNQDTENDFMKKAITWNEIKTSSMVKIKGIFKHEDGNILYAVLPPIWETLYDKLQLIPDPINYKPRLKILQQVLVGLRDIHSRGIVHGAVHPMTVLYDDGKVLLDFNFDKQYLQDKLCLKGINFQVPDMDDVYKSADMYGFGCLVLWVLFPNLSFCSTKEGIPDMQPYTSIVQGMLFEKDFLLLSSLLSSNRDSRPQSTSLVNKRFLNDVRI